MRVNKHLIAQLFSPSIDDTLSLGDIISRVKRSPNYIPNLFRILSKAFAKVYGRERRPASLGTIKDFPTELTEGADTYKPKVKNPLLVSENDNAKWNTHKGNNKKYRNARGRSPPNSCRSYNSCTLKKPKGDKHKEGLRPQDGPGWYNSCLASHHISHTLILSCV